MAATQAQIDEIEVLQAAGAAYDASLLTEWDQTDTDRAYLVGPNDPYELHGAQIASASLTFALTPPKGDPTLNLTSGTPTVDLNATITFKGILNVDDAFTFFIKPGALSVDAAGIVTYDPIGHPYSGSDTVTITWKRNPSVTTARTLTYTP